jgi:hypothetical protein
MSSTPFKFYPFQHINYGTLSGPQTFTDYCFYPDCPSYKFPMNNFNAAFTQQQLNKEQLGLQRWNNSEYSRYPNQGTASSLAQPVYTSNTNVLDNNFMRYSTHLE